MCVKRGKAVDTVSVEKRCMRTHRYGREKRSMTWTRLSTCINDAEIDSALDDLGIPKDPAARVELLHRFMGTTQRFGIGDAGFSPEQEYMLAKAQLLAVNNW